ncbi:MAG: xanthine dehydrogenase family protein subunit M [Anaerolineales bacterium]|jgi:carbon-monoxide dehydrogenase medium subunit|nr:xanthine dehydrogenase family protein subunit M [Anaerolineales bacterium]HJO32811.1 xanthine dehydrogenase family protein subunit M [Anaerolineales bacterium]
MKPVSFKYLSPDSLDDALAAMAKHGADTKLLAGGQSLIPAMNFRVLQPAVLVDMNPLTELNYIRSGDDGGMRIGAMTRIRQLERDPLAAARAPLLHMALPHIAHAQIRNRGTLGGSLVHADPAAELPVVTLALAARYRVQNAASSRWIDSSTFFHGFFDTAIEPDEIMVEIALPPMPARTGYAFLEIARRHGDYAMAGVASLVTLDESGVCQRARLVYLNLGDAPLDAQAAAGLLIGEKQSDELAVAVAAKAAEEEIKPMGSVHASIEYQQHLARVLTRRALIQAFERAEQ